jgi:ssDNA-binding Zn-finger/Zn-ribbon topoisomerase 1
MNETESNRNAHIRVGIQRKGKRINDRGSAGHTLCGADITSRDMSYRDGLNLTDSDAAKFHVCPDCIIKIAPAKPRGKIECPWCQRGTLEKTPPEYHDAPTIIYCPECSSVFKLVPVPEMSP